MRPSEVPRQSKPSPGLRVCSGVAFSDNLFLSASVCGIEAVVSSPKSVTDVTVNDNSVIADPPRFDSITSIGGSECEYTNTYAMVHGAGYVLTRPNQLTSGSETPRAASTGPFSSHLLARSFAGPTICA